MSAEQVEREIARFLSSKTPEVICIRGKWGAGKTFGWKRSLQEAHSQKKLALSQYAYVSLFGINSLADLKYAIFENTVKGAQISNRPSFESFREFVDSVDGLGRRHDWLTKGLAQLFRVSEGLVPGLFLAVSQQIICFDDLERRGSGLALGDVLGLSAFLKEQRNCKVALILNDEALDEVAKDVFEKYLEKVVDASLRFAPSTEEAVSFGLGQESELSKQVGTNCSILGITNIRLIQRIMRSASTLQELLADFDAEIATQIAHTTTLLTWSVFEPGDAPSIEHIKSRLPYAGPTEGISVQQAAWTALLDAYNFPHLDELDVAILDGIKNGYFDATLIKSRASEVQARLRAQKADNRFVDAWRLYHDSFDQNADEIAGAVRQSFESTLTQRTPAEASSTIAILKDLGRATEAEALLRAYVDAPTRNRKFFDLAEYPFPEMVKDPDLIAAFAEKLAAFEPALEGEVALRAMAEKTGWNDDEFNAVTTLTIDDYVRIFKATRGELLRSMISRCLRFATYGNASDQMKEISLRAREALRRIDAESPLNARRVAKFGVSIHPEPTAPPTDG